MGKITAADIDDLKAALTQLENLQTELGSSNGAAAWMKDVTTTTQDFGPMIENSGTSVSQYIDARGQAISTGLGNAQSGVATAIGLLSSTITNYETNEKTHATAADGTGTGGAGRGKG